MARMSGSGSAVFGVFRDADAAERAHAVLAQKYAFCERIGTWHEGVTMTREA